MKGRRSARHAAAFPSHCVGSLQNVAKITTYKVFLTQKLLLEIKRVPWIESFFLVLLLFSSIMKGKCASFLAGDFEKITALRNKFICLWKVNSFAFRDNHTCIYEVIDCQFSAYHIQIQTRINARKTRKQKMTMGLLVAWQKSCFADRVSWHSWFARNPLVIQ